MSNIKVVIDDEVVMDGDTREWEAKQPEFIANQMAQMANVNFRPAPYMRALMLVIAETALSKTSTEAVITTFGIEGWSIDVKYGTP